MRHLLGHALFLLGALCAVALEIVGLNTPFAAPWIPHILLAYFIVSLGISGKIDQLWALPCASFVLEQFVSLPAGYISFLLAAILLGNWWLIRYVTPERSTTAIALLGFEAVFLYEISSRILLVLAGRTTFFSAAPDGFSLWYVFEHAATSALFIGICYYALTHVVRSFNPAYLRNLHSKRA